MPKESHSPTQTHRRVPYAKGFKKPSKKERENAIGSEFNVPEFDPRNTKGFTFFNDLSPPDTEFDWLASNVELGQTYQHYMKRCPWFSLKRQTCSCSEFNCKGKTILEKYPKGKIYLQPIGDISIPGLVDIHILAEYASIYTGITVQVMPQVDVKMENDILRWNQSIHKKDDVHNKEKCIDFRKSESGNHFQLKTESLLDKLFNNLPNNALCYIGLTMYDLYVSDSDLFVAGLASGIRDVAVFSFYRYDPCLAFSEEDWFDVEILTNVKAKDRFQILLERSCKLLVHEIGHLLGIGHCIYYDCCMNGSGHLEEDFKQSPHLCPVDLHKLQSLVGFDVLERYQKLKQFYDKHELYDESEWVSKRINFILSKRKGKQKNVYVSSTK